MQEPTIIDKLKSAPDENQGVLKTDSSSEIQGKKVSYRIIIILLLLMSFLVGGVLYFFLTGRLSWTEQQESEFQNQEDLLENESNDLKTYQNNKKGFSLKYPSDWILSYVEEECPKSLSLVGCENSEIYEYVVDLVKDDYIFEIIKIKDEYLSSNSSYMVFSDSEFIENYQECTGWNEYEDYLELNPTYLEGTYRRNDTWSESVYPDLGGFYIGYRSEDLDDSANLFLSQFPLGSVSYSVPEEYDKAILTEMDAIFESIEIIGGEDLLLTEEWYEYIHKDLGFSLLFPTEGTSLLSFDNSDKSNLEDYVFEKSYIWENKLTNLEEVRINYWKNQGDYSVEELIDLSGLSTQTKYESILIDDVNVYRGYNSYLPQAQDSLSYIFKTEGGEVVEVLYYIGGDIYNSNIIEESISSLKL